MGAEGGDQRVRRGRLADARRAGDPDDLGVPGVRREPGHYLAQQRRDVLDERDQPGDRAGVTGSSPVDEPRDGRPPPAPGRHAGTCRINASPCPPPPHSAAAPVPPPRRFSSSARCSAIRAPDMPTGCPSAIAPPLTLTFSSDRPSSRDEAIPTAANASLIS